MRCGAAVATRHEPRREKGEKRLEGSFFFSKVRRLEGLEQLCGFGKQVEYFF
jgi:hypothetical protein